MSICKLRTPISENDIRKLVVNDVIYLSGIVVTARDQAHKRALDFFRDGKTLPVDLNGNAIFHCGPLVSKREKEWSVIAAGPTTSTRMEKFESEFIKNFKVRVIIGKGGMGEKTTKAMKDYGAIYCAFTGGTAILAAKAIKRVIKGEWLDLGTPEALWVFEIENFGPMTVAIDSHGNNLFLENQKKVEKTKGAIYQKFNIR